jgi:hypothetical protein
MSLFVAQVVMAQTCPWGGTTPNVPVMGDTAISNASGPVDSDGYLPAGSCNGGTGWNASINFGGVQHEVIVSCAHVMKKVGKIIVAPDISQRNCRRFEKICVQPTLGPPSCTLVDDEVELGTVAKVVDPVRVSLLPAGATNLDDAAYSEPNNQGKMSNSLANIGAPGAELDNAPNGTPVWFNSDTITGFGCNQIGTIGSSNQNVCLDYSGQEKCFSGIYLITITSYGGMSGSLLVSKNGNQPIAMMIGGSGSSGIGVPISQVRTDLGLVLPVGAVATVQTIQTNDLGETPEEEQQRLRGAEQKVNDVITKYQARLKRPHVDYIRSAYMAEHGGSIIGVWADKAENVGELERTEPSSLDGYPVIVFPPNRGVAL